jgi:DNA polymerase III epsilon subunit-like protein
VSDPEVLISVDVEASGPSPSTGSLIAIGACAVYQPELTFYRELRPQPGIAWNSGTEAIHGLTRAHLDTVGVDPEEAIRDFAAWVTSVADGRYPVMVGVNVSFDWMFVADYFQRYLGSNPLGVAPLDLKSLFMGRFRVSRWADTTKRSILQYVTVDLPHTHNALDDARMQAQMCAQLMEPPPESE